ncbi:acyl-CoA reductase [Fulvivirgaceae bacterium BMA10]|uniref:Acyl-CoA reductase n=1 Tax=Splendidivirga corallicola TaxID=3051826 RepID=A0ABT8KPA1_9BACT|nr:acyl-CoA reductase [Fulvivirgaceae bacterium BMA10]
MKIESRIAAISELYEVISHLITDDLAVIHQKASAFNNWFTKENIVAALEGAKQYTHPDNLQKWVSQYDLNETEDKKIGVVMAGNIPLVGFHDYLSVLISGHTLIAKLSSQDPFLLPFITDKLIEIEPRFKEKIFFKEKLNDLDAVIATGSDNTAKYFNYYFSKIPNVIRQNRTSCAVLTGNENNEELQALGKDIFQYYGLGCRNVSKLFVPEGYDFTNLIESLKGWEHIGQHHKYHNNYDYNKSIYLVNGEEHLDTGFLLIKRDEGMVSPISVLFFEPYADHESLSTRINEQASKIQCIVSNDTDLKGSVAIGKAQSPDLWDYADHVDTLAFLTNL